MEIPFAKTDRVGARQKRIRPEVIAAVQTQAGELAFDRPGNIFAAGVEGRELALEITERRSLFFGAGKPDDPALLLG